MRIRFYIDPETELPHIFNHTVTEEEVMEVRRMSNNYPPGWDEERVRRVLAHYEQQSEEEAVAEDEAAFKQEGQTFIKSARKPRAFKPGDEWPPGAKRRRSGEAGEPKRNSGL